jgi:hypothetical protein
MKHPSQIEKLPALKKGSDEIVIDVARRLVWMKKDTWQLTGNWMNWVTVRDFAAEMSAKKYSGLKNWRLPSVTEIKSLYNKNQQNTDHMGTTVPHSDEFDPGFCFLCWTSEVRNKIQAARFGFRKGIIIYDDIYRSGRGATRLVRDIEKEEI